MSVTLVEKLNRYFANTPGYLHPENNQNLLALYTAWASEDTRVENAVDAAKREMFVLTADGYFLDILGANCGVRRPTSLYLNDDIYRQLIPKLCIGDILTKGGLANIIDIIFGPTKLRSHCISSNPETYRMMKTIDFVGNGTVGGTFDVSDITDLNIGYEIEIEDDDSPRITAFITDITGGGPYTIEVNDGTLDLTDYTVAQNAQVRTGESMVVETESGTESMRFRSTDFVDTDAVTVDELVTAYNSRMTLTVADRLVASGGVFFRVRTNTIGARGYVHIKAGTARNPIGFDRRVRCQNAQLIIWEDPDDGVVIIDGVEIQVTSRDLRGSWHLRENENIIDGRPTVTSGNPFYPGAFLYGPSGNRFIRSVNTQLNETINAGDFKNAVQFVDVSGFPDNADQFITFGYGTGNEEGPIRYNSRPNNTTLTFNPAIAFAKPHATGDVINLSTPVVGTGNADYGIGLNGYKPRDNGKDFATFVTDPLTMPIVLSEILLQITAAGIPLSFTTESLIYRWAEL